MAALSLVGCGGSPEGASPRRDDAPSATPARSPPKQDAQTAVTMHMKEHLARARGMHDAVVGGDLGTAQDEADWLAQHWPDQVPAGWGAFIRELQAAASRVLAAPELGEAGQGTAAVALACGHCHRAQSTRPSISMPPAPQGEDDAARMRRHRWATDRLWEAVAFDSPSQWEAGWSAFAALPQCQSELEDPRRDKQIARARNATQQLRQKAKSANDVDARARIYGELLSTCGSCHSAGC